MLDFLRSDHKYFIQCVLSCAQLNFQLHSKSVILSTPSSTSCHAVIPQFHILSCCHSPVPHSVVLSFPNSTFCHTVISSSTFCHSPVPHSVILSFPSSGSGCFPWATHCVWLSCSPKCGESTTSLEPLPPREKWVWL